MSKLTNQSTWFSDNEKNWNDRANLHMAGDYCGLRRLLAEPDAISAELASTLGALATLPASKSCICSATLGRTRLDLPVAAPRELWA